MTQTASLESIQEKEMTVVIRPEFKRICQGGACRAAVFNHILYWIAYKRKQGEASWYATGQQIYKQLCETWGISVTRREINALIASGMIGETHNPKWGADRTKHFFFGEAQAKVFFAICTQEKICPWCISHLPPIVSDMLTTHLLILSNAKDESINCICQNHQMQLIDVSNGSDRSNKAITKGSTKGSTKKESSLVANTPASLSADADEGVSFKEEKEEEGRTNGNSPRYHRGVTQQYSGHTLFHTDKASRDTHGTARAQQETLTEDKEKELSAYENHIQVRRQVGHDGITSVTFEDMVKAQEGVGESQEKAPNAPTTDPSPGSQVLPPTADTLQPVLLDAPTPEQISIPASSSETHKTNGCKISGTPPLQPERPKKPETVLLCQPRAIRELIDANRGHSLEERGAIIHQNIVLKDWCAVHPLEHYYLVLEHLKSCRCKNPAHQWWHKEEHWRFLSAEKLAELTPGVLSELGRIPRPAPPEEARSAPLPPVSRGWSPVMTPCPRGR